MVQHGLAGSGAEVAGAAPGAIVVFDIDGVIRDVGNSYRRALADTVEQFTAGAYRPSQEDIDQLKAEGLWNNDWEASQELVYRFYQAQGQSRSQVALDYAALVAFFQSRYRGPDSNHWTGYICQEPLLVQPAYLDSLTQAGMRWGFFSGATRGSATYVLERRLGLQQPVLVAMEDAPGKPDPTGLFATVAQLQPTDLPPLPVFYAGDTVADMYTVIKARELEPQRNWWAIGIVPPHAQTPAARQEQYTELLRQAGGQVVLENVEQLTVSLVQQLINGQRLT